MRTQVIQKPFQRQRPVRVHPRQRFHQNAQLRRPPVGLQQPQIRGVGRQPHRNRILVPMLRQRRRHLHRQLLRIVRRLARVRPPFQIQQRPRLRRHPDVKLLDHQPVHPRRIGPVNPAQAVPMGIIPHRRRLRRNRRRTPRKNRITGQVRKTPVQIRQRRRLRQHRIGLVIAESAAQPEQPEGIPGRNANPPRAINAPPGQIGGDAKGPPLPLDQRNGAPARLGQIRILHHLQPRLGQPRPVHQVNLPLQIVPHPTARPQPRQPQVNAPQVQPRPPVPDARQQYQREQQPVEKGKPGAQRIKQRRQQQQPQQDLAAMLPYRPSNRCDDDGQSIPINQRN